MKKLLLIALLPLCLAAKDPPLKVTLADSPELMVMPTMTFKVYPQKGAAPLTSKITWSTVGAVGCVASGMWTGSRPTSGTETVVSTTKGRYQLTCHGTTPDALVEWQPPTMNVDGTPITNLAGFYIFVSTDTEAVQGANPIKIANPTVKSHLVPGLPVGTNFFSMQAYNTNNAVSAFTGQVYADIPAQAIAMSRYITITEPLPQPPSDVYVNKEPVSTSTGDGTHE